MTNLTFIITRNISDIPRKDWERLFGADIIESYGYHKIIQDAQLKDFNIYFILIKDINSIQAIIPFFTEEFSFTTIIQGPLQKLITLIQKYFKKFLIMNILFVGLPTAEEFYNGISPDLNLEIILQELARFSKLNKIKTILFFNLTARHKTLSAFLKKHFFSKMENYPNTVIEIKANSLYEYIENLSSNTRKDFKRKLRKANYPESFEIEVREDIVGIEDKIYELYMNNFSESDVHFEKLTPIFFKNICQEMPGVAKYFVFWKDKKIVAFNLCLIKNDTCIDKFIGFDKELSRKDHLYQVTFAHNIDWCIKNGIRFYQMGITDYHPKIRLGAKLKPLYNYIKLNNPLFNLFLGPVAKIIEPKNFDPTLKNLKITVRF